MKSINIFNTKMKPVVVVIILAILSLIGIFHYVLFNYTISMLQKQGEELDAMYIEVQWEDIESILDLSILAAHNEAVETANILVDNIKRSYQDLSELSNEFDQGKYNSPKFTEALMNSIQEKHLYGIHNSSNDIFVISKDGIVFDMNVSKIKKINRDFEEEARTHYNEQLTYSALEALLTHNNDALIYYEPLQPIDPEGHNLITIPTRKALKEIFYKEGLDGLRGYIVLVPAYITDNGDVFGVPDIGLDGSVNRNHKLIVVQRFSIYDVMEKIHQHEVLKNKSYLQTRDDLAYQMEFATLSYVSTTILDLIAILFLLLYTTGKTTKES